MATTLTTTNLYTAPYDNIFSILDTRANVANPRDASGLKKFVYKDDPEHKAADFAGFPYIIVYLPMYTNEGATASGKSRLFSYRKTVVVRTIKGGSGGSRTDVGHSDMQSIVESIRKTIDSASIKLTLRRALMFHVNVEVIGYDDTLVYDQRPVYETELEITYSQRQAISA